MSTVATREVCLGEQMKKTLPEVIEAMLVQIEALYEIAGSEAPDSTIRAAAQMFCRLNDDQQAKFFNEVAAIMGRWDHAGALGQQAYYIGRHLATCECSTQEARDLIEGIHYSMKRGGQ